MLKIFQPLSPVATFRNVVEHRTRIVRLPPQKNMLTKLGSLWPNCLMPLAFLQQSALDSSRFVIPIIGQNDTMHQMIKC